jgi:hypothetical protein
MRQLILPIVALCFLPGCATQRDAGWQGKDAHPFGTADSICLSEAKAVARIERDMVYRACMMRHGWSQPPPQER